MAQRTTVSYFSDLSGTELYAAVAGVQFGLDGATYEIDLTPEEQDALRKVLAPYIEAGRKVGGAPIRRRRTSADASKASVTSKEIRAWAIENGHDVPARGRIPSAALEAYHAAH